MLSFRVPGRGVTENLDPFDSADGVFRLFELTDSVTLSYLDNLVLDSGTIIVGFEDTKAQTDHNDMIVALNASYIPIPATIWMLGAGLMGLIGFRRKTQS